MTLQQDNLLYCHSQINKLAEKEKANARGNAEQIRKVNEFFFFFCFTPVHFVFNIKLHCELCIIMNKKEKILRASNVDCEILDELGAKEQSLVRVVVKIVKLDQNYIFTMQHEELNKESALSYNLQTAKAKIVKEKCELEERKRKVKMHIS